MNTLTGGIVIDPIAFNIGPLAVRWYGILIGSAVIIGLLLCLRESKRQNINPEFFLDFVIIGLPAAIIGARLYYVIFKWDFYSDNFSQIFYIWRGGLAIHGAILAGIIVLFLLTKIYKVNFWKTVDILVPSLVLGQAIGRWGNFFNQEAFGGPVTEEFINIFPKFIKKQMHINGNYYHPAFLYESVLNFLLFILLIFFKRKKFIKNGDLFAIYLIAYSTSRYFIEGLRTDSLMLGPFKVAQLVSIIGIIVGIILIYLKHKKVNT